MNKELLEHEHIVIGFEHYNPLGIARTLGENGIQPVGIFFDVKRKFASMSKYYKEVYYVEGVDEGYNLLMTRFARKEKKAFIYTSDDITTSYFDKKFEAIKEHFYFNNAGTKGRVTQFMDKYEILKVAEKNGLPIAKSWVVNKWEIPQDIEYPIITKAIASTKQHWKRDAHVCKNKEELEKAFESIDANRLLLQKYIEKKNELCLDGYVVNGGGVTRICIASTYKYILPSRYSLYMTVKNFEDDELGEKISNVFKEIGYEGIYSLEFLIGKDDQLYFLEINFRNSTWSYASTVAGMPLPVLWAEDMLEPSQEERIVQFTPFNAIAELDDFKARVSSRKINLLKWLRDVRNSKCKYYYVANDVKPIFALLMHKLKLGGGHR